MSEQLSLFDYQSDYYESDVTKYDNQLASFRVHASLIYKLGESLIADEVTALSELIKNTYDADATICALSINTDYHEEIDGIQCQGKIELTDNGCGMDIQTIVNGWLTLSNSPKKKMKKEKRTTPKFHRYPLGDKGLGRLSVQKLGKYMQMVTKASNSNTEYTVIIPWGEFLKNTTIDQIPVTITQKIIDNKKSYTTITIKDLINNELWENKEQIDVLSNSINKIVSPFRTKENNFTIVANINGQAIESVNTIFDDLLSCARAKHIISYSEGKSILKSYYTPSFFYNREMMDNIIKNRFSVNKSSLLDFWRVSQNNLQIFNYCPNKKDVFTSIDECIFQELIYKSDGSYNDEETDPGEFECEIYEYTLDQKFIDHFYQDISYSDLIDQNEYKGFIERFHGIKVERDGFIIQGLGEGDGGDWLGLSSSSKTKGSFFDFRNDSVIGCIYLTGDKNAVLKETTNREGFVEDRYYITFKRILNESIRRINKNRKKLNDEMRTYVKMSLANSASINNDNASFQPTIDRVREQLSKTASIALNDKKRIEETKKDYSVVRKNVERNPFVSQDILANADDLGRNLDILTTNYDTILEERQYLSDQIEAINFDFKKINERLQDLFELAGLGMSVEMFSHEFDSTLRNIRLKNDALIANRADASVNDIMGHIHYINYTLDTLRKQMSYFNPGLKYVRSKKQVFSFKEFIKEHKAFYNQRCINENIIYDDNVEDFYITINKGMLSQVFDNLFNNSEYWLNFSVKHNLIEKKYFFVESKEKGLITVWDNGIGISKDIETRLFEPFETKKKEGRGLGLYIVANNLKYNSSRIRLLNERNKHGNLFKFEIDISAISN